MRIPYSEAAALLHAHYDAFLGERGHAPALVCASEEVVSAWRDLPLNVIATSDSPFRAATLRPLPRLERTTVSNPLR